MAKAVGHRIYLVPGTVFGSMKDNAEKAGMTRQGRFLGQNRRWNSQNLEIDGVDILIPGNSCRK